jgi:divalent metal cation (Fe/Co/Zn/Cd) transporter
MEQDSPTTAAMGDTVNDRDLRVVRWRRIASRLVAATVAYNGVEAGVAIWSGLSAASIALLSFGLDSVIEIAAAAVMLRRLRLEGRGVDRDAVERSERRVHRFVGWTFVALALYVAVEATSTLWHHAEPSESLAGIILAGVSLLVMPVIAWGKLRAAAEIGSGALRAEAKETLACSYLSLTLLVGLAANAVAGWWWADPMAALLMVPWLAREGLEGIRGEDEDEDET